MDPSWYICHNVSTTSTTLEQFRELENMFVGKSFPRPFSFSCAGMRLHDRHSGGGQPQSGEVFYTRPMLHLGSYMLGYSHASILCRMPLVSTSTATLCEHTVSAYSDGTMWRSLTNSEAPCPLPPYIYNRAQGRTKYVCVFRNASRCHPPLCWQQEKQQVTFRTQLTSSRKELPLRTAICRSWVSL